MVETHSGVTDSKGKLLTGWKLFGKSCPFPVPPFHHLLNGLMRFLAPRGYVKS